MTKTIELSDAAAALLTERVSEEEIGPFVSEALLAAFQRQAEQEEQDRRFLALAFPDYDPALEPEREHAEFMAVMEEELADPDPIKNSISLEEAFRRLDETLAALAAGKKL